MAVPPNKRREAPSEPLKRVLGPTVRAIAGDGEIEVDFGPARAKSPANPCIFRNHRALRPPKDIALARGWADSFALRIGCHDAKFIAASRPRLARRAPYSRRLNAPASRGWARRECRAWPRNLTARLEDQYSHDRFEIVSDRAEAPLEDALALLIRERLTGLAAAHVDQRARRSLAPGRSRRAAPSC